MMDSSKSSVGLSPTIFLTFQEIKNGSSSLPLWGLGAAAPECFSDLGAKVHACQTTKTKKKTQKKDQNRQQQRKHSLQIKRNNPTIKIEILKPKSDAQQPPNNTTIPNHKKYLIQKKGARTLLASSHVRGIEMTAN
jgi:hypothetical protein